MPIDSGNLALKGLDDLFSTEENRQEEQREQVQQIPIDALHPFINHPFKVLDDEAMTRTVESIAQYGVLAPLIARPRPDGDGYEIISGHRRQYAAKLAGLDTLPVLPVFINGVASPLPGFQRTRMLGEAIGRFLTTLNKRVLILGSGGLSHQPPVPELAKADAHMRDRLLGSGRQLPPDERELRQQRVISAAKQFIEDQNSLYPLNPVWDTRFMSLLEQGRLAELDAVSNEELSAMAGKSTHEIKPGWPPLPRYPHLADGAAKAAITDQSPSGLPDLAR